MLNRPKTRFFAFFLLGGECINTTRYACYVLGSVHKGHPQNGRFCPQSLSRRLSASVRMGPTSRANVRKFVKACGLFMPIWGISFFYTRCCLCRVSWTYWHVTAVNLRAKCAWLAKATDFRLNDGRFGLDPARITASFYLTDALIFVSCSRILSILKRVTVL